jgi:hypothetical protein
MSSGEDRHETRTELGALTAELPVALADVVFAGRARPVVLSEHELASRADDPSTERARTGEFPAVTPEPETLPPVTAAVLLARGVALLVLLSIAVAVMAFGIAYAAR